MAGTKKLEHLTVARASDQLQEMIQVNNLVTDVETVRQGNISRALNSGALAITGAGSPTVKIGSNLYCFLAGASGAAPSIKMLTAANLAALSGTVTHGNFGVWFFTWDGTTQASVLAGGAVATLAAVPIPSIATTKACFGCVIINPTGTGNFVGGTTNLDDGTVVPNAVYLNFYGAPILSAAQAASGLVASQIASTNGTVVSSSWY